LIEGLGLPIPIDRVGELGSAIRGRRELLMLLLPLLLLRLRLPWLL
jgi:hypothetical protein